MGLEFNEIALEKFVKENEEQLTLKSNKNKKMKLSNLLFSMIDAFYESDAEYNKLFDIIVRIQKTSDIAYDQDEIDLVVMQEKFFLVEIGKIAIYALNILKEIKSFEVDDYIDHLELKEIKMNNNIEKLAKIVRGHMTYTRGYLFKDEELDQLDENFKQFSLIMLNYCGYRIEEINGFNKSHQMNTCYSSGGILEAVLEKFI